MPKPSPAFEVYAPAIFPERVPFHALAKLISAVQRLAAGPSSDEIDETLDDGVDNLFGLLGVKRGSSRYEISSLWPEQSVKNIRDVGKVLVKPDTIGPREYILGPVHTLSEISRSLNSMIQIREPGRSGAILATIQPSTYSALSERLLVKGETTIFGKVERVGGATSKKCGLRLVGRSKMLICNVHNQEVARRLGQKLYEEVSVSGVAQWLKTTWNVVHFNIRDLCQANQKSTDDIIKSLRDAGGDGWDKVDDPEAFLNDVAG